MDDHFRHSSSLRTHRQTRPALITTCTLDRQSLLQEPDCARIVLDAMIWMDRERQLILIAAVVMPDHIHFVADPLGSDWSVMMRTLKRFTSRKSNQRLGRDGPVWQSQYHDRRVLDERELTAAVQYCLDNPVRAGLVESVADYAFVWMRFG